LESVDLCLQNTKIPYKGLLIDAGVAINEGKIVAIRKVPLLPDADRRIDLGGALLLPGIVDVHVHFRDPGLTWKEDFATGSKAAAAGGVTAVCDMPNCIPPTNSLKRFEEKVKIAEDNSYVDFGLHAALPASLREGSKIRLAGAVSFNLGEIHSELKEIPGEDFLDLGLTISAHAENPRLFKKSEFKKGDVGGFIRFRHKSAEISAVSRLLRLAGRTHLHLCHVSARESAGLIAEGKRRGMKVTCETTPHHVLLSLVHLRRLKSIAKTYPPLRSATDKSSIFESLRNGTIDIVASDHAPHSSEEKREDIWKAPGGIAGVETSLPLMFTLVKKGELSIFRLIDAMCARPAKVFDLRNESGILKGTISEGADADFVAIDGKKKWKIRGEELHGKTKFTPFEGWEVIGKPFMTILRGEVIFEGGEICGKQGFGRFIPRNP
jgi:dihydroorotase